MAPDDGRAGTVDSQVRSVADGEDETGEEEDGARDDGEEYEGDRMTGRGLSWWPRGRAFPTALAWLRGVQPIRYTLGSPDGGHGVLFEDERFRAPCSSVAQR